MSIKIKKTKIIYVGMLFLITLNALTILFETVILNTINSFQQTAGSIETAFYLWIISMAILFESIVLFSVATFFVKPKMQVVSLFLLTLSMTLLFLTTYKYLMG